MSPGSGGGADGLSLGFRPGRGAKDAVAVAAVCVAGGDLHHFLQQAVIEVGGVEAQLDKAAVIHDQNVVAVIRQVHRTVLAAEAVTAENENFHYSTF